jgi:hypothetical protein
MKRAVGGFVATVFAMQMVPGAAWAGGCASQADASALRVAALQQELMVAAFTCHDVSRYNNFVRAHQPELIASDDTLKAYFVRRSGEAAYHTYKTELANSASLRSVRDDGFCGRADHEFDVSSERDSLSDYVGAHRFAAADVYPVCEGVTLRTADASDPDGDAPRVHHRHHRYDADAADRDDGYYRSDRDSSEFDAPVPHRHVDDSDR